MNTIPMNNLRVGARRIISAVGSRITRTSEPRILMYHRIFASDHRLAVTPELFRRHLDLFQELGLEVLSVADLLTRRNEPDLHAIALSFDDGYQEIASLVAPELKARGMGATFFVLPRLASDPVNLSPNAAWSDGGTKYLSHEQIVELDRDGFEIAAHGLTHRCLPDLPSMIVRKELVESRRELENLLGHRVRGFAYPKGEYLFEHSTMVRQADFDYAVTVDPGHVANGSPDCLLPRTEVAGGDDPILLKNKLAGGLDHWHCSLQASRKLRRMMTGRA